VSVTYPCSAQVVAATNPCPCGFADDWRVPCRCSTRSIERYRRRLSGPLLDRFDVQVRVGRLGADELDGPPGEPSPMVRARVEAARHRQRRRGRLNRDLRRGDLDAVTWSPEAVALLRDAVGEHHLTGRGWDRVRRVARTIADLESGDDVSGRHMAAALELRGGS
jgi:magnesium chelatase family protein